MKIETFCKRTGWPFEEWQELPMSHALEILGLYGLVMSLGGVEFTTVPEFYVVLNAWLEKQRKKPEHLFSRIRSKRYG